MANQKHLRILKKGVRAWNQWRKDNSKIQPNLSGANLRGANLSKADLRGANLGEADLSRSGLYRADLTGAKLGGANLNRTNLDKANLSRTSLNVADLSWTNLNEANLTDAFVAFTTFGHVDLSSVKGIETIHHAGPSSIGIDTIYRSQGKIPEIFLRSAGVPDNFIEYMHSLVGTAFEFYSCFISYSGRDQEFADRIYEGLQNNGVRCWFAPHHVQGGKKLHEQIDDAIRRFERLLLILTPDSIESQWVKTEITKASKREKQEGKRVLFPIRVNLPFDKLGGWELFDPFGSKDLAHEIAEYYIPDFTHWKDHDSFQKEFQKLLRDLKKPDAVRAKASG